MLLKSGTNLYTGAFEFVNAKGNMVLFSAYLKTTTLKELNINQNIKQIIVRWEVQDLCMGASDLEVYKYCRYNNIILYRNTRIHLKALWDNHQSVFFGSANATGRGLGEKGNFNYELNGEYHNMTLEDRMYLQSIINTSQVVDQDLYEELKSKVEKFKAETPEIKYPEISSEKNLSHKFLLSELPMTAHPAELFINYASQENELHDFDARCLINDLCTYGVTLGLSKENFLDELGSAFNNHPFIEALKGHIKINESLRYGSVVSWLQANTTTVPTPRSYEIKQDLVVNILYTWLCFFDSDFYWDRPNHSQIIYFRNNDVKF